MRRWAWLALVLVAGLTAATPASAAISASKISVPAEGAEFFYNGDTASGSVTVRGTVRGAISGSKGDLLCYSSADTLYAKLAGGINVAAGSFAGSFSLAPLAGRACRLALVPAGTTPTAQRAAAFAGPRIVVNDQFSRSSHGNLYGYDILAGPLAWAFELNSAGECAIYASYATDPGTLGSFTLFAGNGCLPQESGISPALNPRSALRVDGQNAYLPGAIPALDGQAGFEPLSYSAAFNAAHDAVTVSESELAMVCQAPSAYPPTRTNCPTLHDAGVEIRQTTTILSQGQAARVSQRVSSIDGRTHQLDILFTQRIWGPTSQTVPAFEFPGETVFSTHAANDSFSAFPAGAGSIIAVGNPKAVAGIANPVGAITYGRPPLSADFITPRGTQKAAFLMHYVDSLPAGGSVQYDWSYSQAASIPALDLIERVERDRFSIPTLAISRPAQAAVVRRPQLVVKGQASDPVAVASVTVAGQVALLSAGGAFTTSVRLHPGQNAIVVSARNIAGNTRTASVTVDYEPLPCVVPKLRGVTLTAARRALTRADCRVGRITRRQSSAVGNGRVISSFPAAGTQEAPNAKIRLVVSRGL